MCAPYIIVAEFNMYIYIYIYIYIYNSVLFFTGIYGYILFTSEFNFVKHNIFIFLSNI